VIFIIGVLIGRWLAVQGRRRRYARAPIVEHAGGFNPRRIDGARDSDMKAVYKALAAIAIVPIGWTSTAAAQPNEKQKAFVENSLSRLNLSTAKTVGLTAFAIHFVERCEPPRVRRKPFGLSHAAMTVVRTRRSIYARYLPRQGNQRVGRPRSCGRLLLPS
jgi:hypothetical protein